MAMEKLISVLFSKFILLLLFLDVTNACGLQLGFYSGTCPNAEQIAYSVLYKYISRDPTLAPSLLRMHFHDCFVRVRRTFKIYIYICVHARARVRPCV